jgi:hypothetical protein
MCPLLPSFAGEVSPLYGDGGVKSLSGAFDPSVRDYADTSPAKLGRRSMSATSAEVTPP